MYKISKFFKKIPLENHIPEHSKKFVVVQTKLKTKLNYKIYWKKLRQITLKPIQTHTPQKQKRSKFGSATDTTWRCSKRRDVVTDWKVVSLSSRRDSYLLWILSFTCWIFGSVTMILYIFLVRTDTLSSRFRLFLSIRCIRDTFYIYIFLRLKCSLLEIDSCFSFDIHLDLHLRLIDCIEEFLKRGEFNIW